MMNRLRHALPDMLVVLAFVAIATFYFLPAALDGRVRVDGDATAGVGAGTELADYYERTGERTRWTNALFGGMPTYQLAPSYHSTDTLRKVERVWRLFLPDDIGLVFIMLLGFYFMLRLFRLRPMLAALGSVLWAFSSYFFIIIAAGHIWKFITLAYIPPTIGGLILIYRGKWLWGAMVTALFVALQILANHEQMSYYFMMVMLFMVVAFGVDAWRNGKLTHFLRSSAVLVAAGLLGVAVNASNLYHTYQYAQETRGASELKMQGENQATQSGLNRSYITQWSYGIGETWTLLVPNVKGGASVPLARNERAMQKAEPMYASIYRQIGQYWGEQPGTSGPVYVGAFVLTLFFLGLFTLRGPLKWALLTATILSILLSWGENFMAFTDFFIDHVPLYNKFRAVTSILVVAEFCIPLLAVLTLRNILTEPFKYKPFIISLLLTGGVALLFALCPTLFFSSFISSAELSALQRSDLGEHLLPIISNLETIRQSIFTADAWRSVVVIAVGSLLILAYVKGKLRGNYMVMAIALLCLVDMWNVNKRYLNDTDYVEPRIQQNSFAPTAADRTILSDTAKDYRVLNLTTNTFNENNTSFWHKSIGGYHAAKLRRYQELIDYYLLDDMKMIHHYAATHDGDLAAEPSAWEVLNMLNTRWVIMPTTGEPCAVFNPYAFGNAWSVSQVLMVDDATAELAALGEVDMHHTAVIDKRFEPSMMAYQHATVELTAYEPNALTYHVSGEGNAMCIFSEIYYPGWQATIDGHSAPVLRANYVLRALEVPAGNHTVQFTFRPPSLHTTECMAWITLALLAALMAWGIWRYGKSIFTN